MSQEADVLAVQAHWKKAQFYITDEVQRF